MIIKNERLIYKRSSSNNIYLFTANSVINGGGRLVMGAGCAKSARDTYTDIDRMFAQRIVYNKSKFNLVFVEWCGTWVGAFQTKIDWRSKSPIEIIIRSIESLKIMAESRYQYNFHLPFPGVCNGGLTRCQILPFLTTLPDNVLVYDDV